MTSTQPELALSIQGLHKVYRRGLLRKRHVALESLDLEVPAGGIYGFIGHNGAGKTTTIKLLMGLARPTRGTAVVLGRPIGHLTSLARIGFLPERPYFYDYLTGTEFLEFYARLFGIPAAVGRSRTAELLRTVELGSAGSNQLRTYSKGMLQRIGVAQALINDPALVILDEPMSGLDPAGRRLIRNQIMRMRDDGRTVFFSSHILSDVEMICDRIGILVRGRLHYSGGVADLLDQHTNRVEIRAENVPGEATGKLVELADEAAEHGAQWLIRCEEGDPARDILAFLTSRGARVVSVAPIRPSLEELFMRELTGTSPGGQP